MTPQQTVDKALEIAGNQHKYQKIIILFICVTWALNTFLVLGPSFYYMDPIFKCGTDDKTYDEEYACSRLSQCTLDNDYTIVAYAGLYCDRQGQRDLIQSTLPIGSFLGLILMNYMSDRKGRRLTIISDLLIGLFGIIFVIIGAYTKMIEIMVLGSIMCGFCGYSLVILSYIFIGDFCEDNLRQKGVALMNLSWSVGMLSFYPLYQWCNEWYNILILFMLIPMIGLILTSFFLIEQSPKFLLCKKKSKKECLSVLLTVAAYNNKTKLQTSQIQSLIYSVQLSSTSSREPSMIEVYKQWKYLKIILFTGITETGGNLIFYGISFAMNDIGLSYGVNNLLLGTTQIITSFALTFFVMKVKRKKTIFICYIISGLLGCSFIFPFINSSTIFSSLIIAVLRVCTTIGYSMIAMIQTESFPLQIQSIGAGSIEGLGQFGCFLSPLLVAIAINTGINKMFILSLGLLVLLFPLKFVPETFNKHQQAKEHSEEEQSEDLKQSLLSN